MAPGSVGSIYLLLPVSSGSDCLTNRTVSWFPSPATSNGACRFPALCSPARFARRFMGRSQWAVLSMLSIYSIPSHHFRLPLPVYPLSQVLQIAERFYQTLLPPIIARGIAKQLGPFAPWELPQFIRRLSVLVDFRIGRSLCEAHPSSAPTKASFKL